MYDGKDDGKMKDINVNSSPQHFVDSVNPPISDSNLLDMSELLNITATDKLKEHLETFIVHDSTVVLNPLDIPEEPIVPTKEYKRKTVLGRFVNDNQIDLVDLVTNFDPEEDDISDDRVLDVFETIDDSLILPAIVDHDDYTKYKNNLEKSLNSEIHLLAPDILSIFQQYSVDSEMAHDMIKQISELHKEKSAIDKHRLLVKESKLYKYRYHEYDLMDVLHRDLPFLEYTSHLMTDSLAEIKGSVESHLEPCVELKTKVGDDDDSTNNNRDESEMSDTLSHISKDYLHLSKPVKNDLSEENIPLGRDLLKLNQVPSEQGLSISSKYSHIVGEGDLDDSYYIDSDGDGSDSSF